MVTTKTKTKSILTLSMDINKLKEVVKIVKAVRAEPVFLFTPNGLSFCTSDKSHSIAVELTLDKGFFDTYAIEVPEFKACLDLNAITEFLSACMGKTVTLTYESDKQTFYLVSGNLRRRFGLLTEEPGASLASLPTLALPARVVVKADEIKPAIKASLALSNTILIKIDTNGFHMGVENDNCTDSIDVDIAKDYLDTLEVKGEEKSTYDLLILAEHFNTISQLAVLDMTLGTDFPIRIEWSLDKSGDSKFSLAILMLAPRVIHE